MDGNTADYSKDFPKGTLKGVKATYPGAQLKDDFKARLLETNPKLKDFTYGPESYDATVLSALAAEAAKSDDGVALSQEDPGSLRGRRRSAPPTRTASRCSRTARTSTMTVSPARST